MSDLDKGEQNRAQEVEVNKVEYPFEFFDAQVQFARRWAQLNSDDFASTLKSHTMIFKRVADSDEEKWNELLKQVKDLPEEVQSQAIYDSYLASPTSKYVDPDYDRIDGKHFGFFAFDYYPHSSLNDGKNVIKVHFNNTQRGAKSALHADFLYQRRLDVKRMFDYIKEKYPDAEQVVGGSWIYNLPAYRDSFPPEFTQPQNVRRLVPPGFEDMIPNSTPNMVYTGTSVWGQFVDRKGWVRRPHYDTFIQNVQNAHTPLELVNAFPEPTLQPKVPISVFHNWTPSK